MLLLCRKDWLNDISWVWVSTASFLEVLTAGLRSSELQFALALDSVNTVVAFTSMSFKDAVLFSKVLLDWFPGELSAFSLFS